MSCLLLLIQRTKDLTQIRRCTNMSSLHCQFLNADGGGWMDICCTMDMAVAFLCWITEPKILNHLVKHPQQLRDLSASYMWTSKSDLFFRSVDVVCFFKRYLCCDWTVDSKVCTNNIQVAQAENIMTACQNLLQNTSSWGEKKKFQITEHVNCFHMWLLLY